MKYISLLLISMWCCSFQSSNNPTKLYVLVSNMENDNGELILDFYTSKKGFLNAEYAVRRVVTTIKDGKGIFGTTEIVMDGGELRGRVDLLTHITGFTPLVQEFIEGDEYGVEMVCKEGAPLATFTHKRIRSLSPRGGTSVVKETAEENTITQKMELSALKLVEALLWTGPIMVEFKADKRDGLPRLMEINGRWWGSLPLALEAGVDFPWVHHKYLYGSMGGKPTVFHPHSVRTRHFLGDVKWLLSVLFKHDPMRKRLYPSRIYALWLFIIATVTAKGDIFSLSDLGPSIMEYADVINRMRK